MDKLKQESVDLTEQNIDKIGAMFPNVITETKDEDGNLKKAINFTLLKQMLSKEVVDGDECYEFTWVGKKQSIIEGNTPIRKTLRPCKEESKDWDTTENLYIEGDNLEVLKLLQGSYLNAIKMIYIDPPYNTGNDFVYRDNFAMSKEEYDEESGLFDEDENRLFKNSKSNGRYHSDWCSMMYPRLQLARNLLTDDGVIFISIDDNEVDNLRKICDEVFGEENCIAQFIWKTDGNFDNQAKVKICHEYILLYSKNSHRFESPQVIDPNVSKNSKLFKNQIKNTIIKNGPKNPVSDILLPSGFPCEIEELYIESQNTFWPHYKNSAGVKNYKLVSDLIVSSGWSSKSLLEEFIQNKFEPITDGKGQETRFIISKTGAIEVIKERSKFQSHVVSVLEKMGGTQKASSELESIQISGFDYPKSISLVSYLSSMINSNNHIILDFFSGSSTTAHAVMQLNAEDRGNRKFIMVQLPEETDAKSEAYKAGYKNICEIGKERIRRAGEKIKSELETRKAELKKKDTLVLNFDEADNSESAINNSALDTGFRVLKLDTTNMKDVYYSPAEYSQQMLLNLESNIKEDRTDLDLLFGVLVDWGVPLSLPLQTKEIEGKAVHFVNDTDLVACFEEGISESLIREVAKAKPMRVVFRDSSFANSPDKINVTEIFKTISPDTTIKVI